MTPNDINMQMQWDLVWSASPYFWPMHNQGQKVGASRLDYISGTHLMRLARKVRTGALPTCTDEEWSIWAECLRCSRRDVSDPESLITDCPPVTPRREMGRGGQGS